MNMLLRAKSKLIAFLIILLISIPTLFAANSWQWDAAGGAGSLNNLDLEDEDEDPDPKPNKYKNGEWWSKPGFLGRFVYTGEGDNELTFTNIGPVPTSAGGNSDKFHYTRVGHTDNWRRVFLVATIIGRTHDGTRVPLSPNTILERSGDILTIPDGAGNETYPVGDPNFGKGYNGQGELYSGSASDPDYNWVYPYQLYWVDITVIRMDKDRDLEDGRYESQIGINGNGVSMALSLGGYVDSSQRIESYSFNVDRVSPDIIPFGELLQKKTLNNSYLVGYLRYNSVDKRANIYFASDHSGNFTNFMFQSGVNSFPYKVGFKSNTPPGSLTEITSTNTKFPTTSTKVPVVSPVFGETQNQYVLNGEIRIFVGTELTLYSMPADSYTSTIYCFVDAW